MMLHNKVAVITGAASGIGRKIAIIFSNKGTSLALYDVDKKEVTRTAGMIEKQGGRAIPVVADVSNEKEVKKLIKETIREYGKFDIACNNAGVSGEMAAKEIRVNAIAPAFIETPMLKKAGITTDEEMKTSVVDLHPMGRLGRPEEVADADLWLASGESSFVTGHTLLVDGGYTVR